MAEKIQKIYDLQELGGERILTILDGINRQFAEIKRTKQALGKESLKATLDGDTEAIRKQQQQFEELRLKELQLKIERQELINQAKQMQLVRQQEIAQDRLVASGATAVAGSYNAIATEYKRTLQQLKNGTSLADAMKIGDAQKKLIALKTQLDNFNRKLSPDGTLIGEYKTGILNAFKGAGLTDLITNQLTKAKAKTAELNAQFEKLKVELKAVQATGTGSMDSLERQLIENRTAAAQLRTQISGIEQGLRNTGVGSQIVNGLRDSFKDLGKQIVQVAIGYLGIQAALGAIRRETGFAKELSDSTTSLEIELGKVKGGADDLVKSLGDLDTRTKLNGLEQIAITASKAGTSAQNLFSVSEAVDKVSIAFGSDFGSVEQGTETFAQLINIFYEDREISGDRILKIGNAIRTLANETVASVPFINDFTGRMAGLKQLFKNFELSQSIGLAAGFQEFKQSAEVTSTVLVKILPKLAADTEKYGAIIGVTKQEFSDLINNNPVEALLRVSEALVKTKGGVEGISQALGDAELGAGRITTVIATMGGKADIFRDRITRAGEAIQTTDSITAAFNAKNENLAATLDKLSKKFADAANNKAFQATLIALSSVILLLIGNLPTLLTIVGLWAAGWAVANKELVLQYSRLLLINGQLLVSRIALGALSIAQAAYNLVLSRTTAEAILYRIAMSSFPFAWLILSLAALVGAFVALGTILFSSSERLTQLNKQYQLNAEIQDEVAKSIASTTSKITALTSVLKDNTLSLAARKLALQQLIDISPEYLRGLTLENIRTAEGTKIINGYIAVLKKKAEAQAINNGLTKAEEKLNEAQRNELRAASDPVFAKAEYAKQTTTPFFSSLYDAAKFGTLDSEQAAMKAYYRALQDQAQKEIDFFTKKMSGQIVDSAKQISETTQGNIKKTIGERRTELTNLIKDLEDAYDQLAQTDAKGREKNTTQRQAYKVELDSLDTDKNGKPAKEKTYNGAKLSGDTKDSVKLAEAETSLLIVELEKRKEKATISESDYYKELDRITQEGIKKKLAVINDGNAEEKKQRADLQLQSIKSTKETNDKLYDIGEKAAKQDLESAKRSANNKLKLVTDNVNSTELDKAQAQLKYDQEALAAMEDFNETMDHLEVNYAHKSLENAQKRADDITDADRKLLNDRIELNKKIFDSTFKSIDDSTVSSTNNEDSDYAKKQTDIYKRQFNSEEARTKALEELERQHQANILQIQNASITAKLSQLEDFHNKGIINEKDYKEQFEKLNKDLGENTADQTKLALDERLKSFEKWKDALDKIIKGIEAVNSSIIQPLFDIQKQRIENEQKQTNAEQDAQKERALNLATSQAEKDAIEKDYDQKRAASDKKYGEERRKIALKELAIDSAIAALKALLSLPNYTQVAINLGLVGASYALQRKKIQEQTFEKGGKLNSTLNNGGVFDGPSHDAGGIPISHNEVEGKEGYVINKKSMASNKTMTVTGTPAQISSAANVAGGGIDFAPGASKFMYEYGGSLGMNLQAPVILPRQYSTSGTTQNSAQILETMSAQANAIASMSQQLLTLKVQLNPNEVTNYQTKKTKAVSIATL